MMFRYTKIVLIAILIFTHSFLIAQNQDKELAEEYFQQEEYEKAISLYEKMSNDGVPLNEIYPNYLQSLTAVKNFKEAEKLINKQIRDNPENPVYRIDAGTLLEMQGKTDKANDVFATVVEEVKKNPEQVIKAAGYFVKIQKLELAETTLLTARKYSKLPNSFAPELADVYAMQNRKEEMIGEYLNLALEEKDYLDLVRNSLQDRLNKQEDYDILEKILLERSQSNPNETIYSELLLWLYMQQKLFGKAFIQAKALDKRYKLYGSELLNVGMIALKNEDYTNAMKIFEYIVVQYPKSPNYAIARNNYLKAKEAVIKSSYPVKKEDIVSLINDYQVLINELGNGITSVESKRNMALLYAFYLDDKDKAIAILNEAARTTGSSDNSLAADCKIDLADIYLLKGEPWEATLLYSQVEKDRKETPKGYEAKLRNAKLSYFKGEFDLAKEHLDILKMATSREIANDAMNLSLLIQDNTVFDTLGLALKEFARIELLIFQHKEDSALAALNQMLVDYPNHSLSDDILFKKGGLLLRFGKPEEAIGIFQKLVELYGEDILGDDAHFQIARIYEEQLHDKEKAMEYYQNHLTKYKGSIFCVEARKRFRILRGDFLN